MADSNQFGEPLWKQKFYDQLKTNGVHKSPFMNDKNMLESLAKAIVGLGYSQVQADQLAILIGDTPELDGDFVVVRSGDEVLARLPLSAFPDFL